MSQSPMTLFKRPEELESCWEDEERMGFLFSAFPQTPELNLDHWNDKMGFWSRVISASCSSSASVCVDFKTVEGWVAWRGRKPLGLQLVWDKMVKEGSLVSPGEYLGDLVRNSSWLGWGVNMFVRKPTLWAADKVLSPLKSLSPVRNNSDRKPYICVKAFQNKSEHLLRLLRSPHPSPLPGLVSITKYCELALDIVADRKEAEMILLALERQKKVVVFHPRDDSQKFIKFGSCGDSVDPVNELDIGVVRLLDAEKQLREQISVLYSQHHSSQEAAKDYVSKEEKILALNCLRQKRRALQSIEKKERCLDNIQRLMSRLEQSNTDKLVLDAYKAGVRAYKSNAVSIDDVDAAMDDLTSALSDCDEVASAISAPVDDNVSVDALEEELRELLISGDDNLTSNQTDADIAKLVTGLTPTPICSSLTPPPNFSRRKASKQVAS